MSEIERTETFYLDSRKVTINFLKKTTYYIRDPQLFIDVILNVCRKNKYALVLPEIVFDIKLREPYPSNAMGYIIPGMETPTVVLVVENILANSGHRYTNIVLQYVLKRTVIHEITHLWHDYVYQSIKLSREASTRLRTAFHNVSPSRDSHFNLKNVRGYFFNFPRDLQLEGVAVYSEYQMKAHLPFTLPKFVYLMIIAKAEVGKIQDEFTRFKISPPDNQKIEMSMRDLFPSSFESKYDIGVHMVYTIIYVRHYSLDKVAGMKPFEFVKEYESCMAKQKLRPLISATSGRGIFDYKRTLEELSALWKNSS